MDNPHFEVVVWFEPDIPFKVLGGYDYKVFVFRKISGGNYDNEAMVKKIKRQRLEEGTFLVESFHFETPFSNGEMEARRISSGIDSLGFVYDLKGMEFSPTFLIPAEDLKREEEVKLRITADIFPAEAIPPGTLLLVFSIEDEHKVLHYVSVDLMSGHLKENIWRKAGYVFNVPRNIKNETTLKSYIWNRNRKSVLMDNFKLEISGYLNAQ